MEPPREVIEYLEKYGLRLTGSQTDEQWYLSTTWAGDEPTHVTYALPPSVLEVSDDD